MCILEVNIHLKLKTHQKRSPCEPGNLRAIAIPNTSQLCGKDYYMISMSQPKSNTHPWCVIRQLPNMQRIVVARFRRRQDADGYLQILRQLMPNISHMIVFDFPVQAQLHRD
jgi:hypothetical protein